MALPPSSPAEQEEEEKERLHLATLHLLGHPLPALIQSPSTGVSKAIPVEDGETSESVDLFLLSLEKPVMLFLFPGIDLSPDATASSSSMSKPLADCTSHLLAIQEHLPILKETEQKRTGEELQVFGMSTLPLEGLSEIVKTLNLAFPLLSDASLHFSKALELPFVSSHTTSPFGSPSDSSTTTGLYLHPLTLLLREGQVVRKDFPYSSQISYAGVGERARRLLDPHPLE